MRSIKKKLLWIDDDIDKLTEYVNELRKIKINVYTAKDFEEANKIFNKEEPHVVVVDIRMPDPDGIEIIRRFRDIDSTRIYAVLSSYLYLNKYRESLAELDIRVQLMDKDFPRVSDPTFQERFIRPFLNLFEKGVSYTIVDKCDSERAIHEVDPFALEFPDFMIKPIIEKDKLLDKAYLSVKNILGNFYERGYVWVLFCGNKERPVRFVEKIEDIPAEDEILEFARKINRAPYQFFRGLIIEDHWTSCAKGDNISQIDYPTVTLIFNDGEEMELHFDTGCPYNMFSYEELAGKKIIPPAVTFGLEERNGFTPYKVVRVNNVSAILKSQKSEETIGVKISGTAVREWHQSSYARKISDYCSSNCDKKFNDMDLCPLRRALIGRNILIENKLAIVLDGELKKTYFPGEL